MFMVVMHLVGGCLGCLRVRLVCILGYLYFRKLLCCDFGHLWGGLVYASFWFAGTRCFLLMYLMFILMFLVVLS